MNDHRRIAEAWLQATLANDPEAKANIYAPNAVFWDTVSETEIGCEAAQARRDSTDGVVDELHYEDQRLQASDEGFVFQAVFACRLKGSEKSIRVPLCVVGRIAGDKVVRIEEYLPEREYAAVRERLMDQPSH